MGSDLNALEGINTLPSRVSVKTRILETPCSPEIVSERGEDRVCSGITRGKII